MQIGDIIQKLLENRGLTNPKAIHDFFHPTHPKDLPSPFDSASAISLIKHHMAHQSAIFIYGDYDVDGICSTALLWETLHASYPAVLPFIPHRETDGYGLSLSGIDHCLSQGAKLIITVDNGIVAHSQIAYCRSQGCDVIIIDHHEADSQLPNANCILHSTSSCAAGLTWFFCRDYLKSLPSLELVALATVCDLIPLLGVNRSFVTYGLADFRSTTRPGILALLSEAGLNTEYRILNTYELGFVIGPRINAMGRLEHAIDSLRLICTKDSATAANLAKLLGDTNRTRQDETQSALTHALSQSFASDILVVSDPTYHPGIIGLISGKLTEKYYRPSIAISVGELQSKGSARSIPGFHITDHIRQFAQLLVSHGGHAMAAGFTIENSKLDQFIQLIQSAQIPPELLVRQQRIDAEIPLEIISMDLYLRLQDFAPFGLGNPTPVFKTTNVTISSPRRIGKENKHLKFKVGSLDAIYFSAPPDTEYRSPNTFDIVYSLDLNTWNSQSTLQLLVKGIYLSK